MNQVYFIHLVLARLSLRQAFGVTPNADLASSNDSAPFRASSAATSPRSVLLWGMGLAVWVLASSGCVGTRGGPPPRFAPRPGLATMSGLPSGGSARMGALAMEPEQSSVRDFQPALHEAGYHTPAPAHSLPCRMGLLGKRMDTGGGECSCAAEGSEPQPRESLTLPWLREGHKSKPPEVSRFHPVPTRPVFQPETIGW